MEKPHKTDSASPTGVRGIWGRRTAAARVSDRLRRARTRGAAHDCFVHQFYEASVVWWLASRIRQENRS
uniref:Uncharacterized protein n=1 Tax=Kalanchoe fedtschenkoi TaxID=63787 RepID=A0A7N0UUL8_KALFE